MGGSFFRGTAMEPDDNIIDLATERRRRGPRFDGGLMDILEVSRDMVCLCRGGAITAINGAGARMLGAATTEAVLGRQMSEFLVPEYGRMLELFLAGLASEDQPVPTRILAMDGLAKAVEMQTFRAREIAADATVVVCREIGADTEAAIRLHDSDVRFRLLVDNARNMVCHVESGIIRYINQAGVAQMGYDRPQAVLERPLADVLRSGDGSPMDDDALLAAAKAKRPVPIILTTGEGVDDHPLAARVTVVPSTQGLGVMIEVMRTA